MRAPKARLGNARGKTPKRASQKSNFRQVKFTLLRSSSLPKNAGNTWWRCQSRGEMNQAKQAAREALALDPRRLVALRLLASIAMSERDYPGALEFLNKMLAMRSNDAWVRVEMGIAYAQTGQPQQALAYLEPLLAAGYPDERGALHGMLAGVLRKLGREQEAQIAAAEANRLSDLFQQHLKTGLDDHQ